MIVNIAKAISAHGARVRYAAAMEKGGEFVASNIPGAERDPVVAIETLERVSALRPTKTKPSAHFSIRPRDDEYLTSEQWGEIAELAAQRLGFEHAPWVAYIHHDKGPPHLHVLASYVTFTGGTVSTSWDRRAAVELARELEKRFGLSPVASPLGERKSPQIGEVYDERAVVPARRHLQEAIDRARQSASDFPAFAAALEREQVRVTLSRTSTGRVLGLSYEHAGDRFSGSQLGRRYAWPSIREQFDVRPDQLDGFPLRQQPPSQDRAEPAVIGPSAPSLPISEVREAIRAHLEALGAERYAVIIQAPETTERITRSNWSAADVEKAAAFLLAHNESGAEILMRPYPPPIALTLTDAQLATAYQLGHVPAAVVQTGPDQSDVWFRPPRELEPAEHRALAARLLEDLDASSDRASNLAHLAGFRAHGGERAELVDSSGARLPQPVLPEASERRPGPDVAAQIAAIFHAQGLPSTAEPTPALVASARTGKPSVEAFRDHLLLSLHRLAEPPPLPKAPVELQPLAQAAQHHTDLIDAWWLRLHLARELSSEPTRREVPAEIQWSRLEEANRQIRSLTEATEGAYRAAGVAPLVPIPAPPLTLQALAHAPDALLTELRLAAALETFRRTGEILPPVRADRLRRLTPEQLEDRSSRASARVAYALARYRLDPAADPRPLAVALHRALGYHDEIARRAALPRSPEELSARLASLPTRAQDLPYVALHARTARAAPEGSLLVAAARVPARLRPLARPHEIPTAAGREAAKFAVRALPVPPALRSGPFALYDALRVDRSAPAKVTLFAETSLRSALGAIGLSGITASVAAAAIVGAITLAAKALSPSEGDRSRSGGPLR